MTFGKTMQKMYSMNLMKWVSIKGEIACSKRSQKTSLPVNLLSQKAIMITLAILLQHNINTTGLCALARQLEMRLVSQAH